jgi:hypothetical protein
MLAPLVTILTIAAPNHNTTFARYRAQVHRALQLSTPTTTVHHGFKPVPAWSLAPRWPFPRIPFHAETAHGPQCGLLSLEKCQQIEVGGFHPEVHMRDVLAAVAADCLLPSADCLCVDAGANVGLVSLQLLQLGCSTLAIEPQTDLAAAARASARYNGWADRYELLNGGVTLASEGGTLKLGSVQLYRYGGKRPRSEEAQARARARMHGTRARAHERTSAHRSRVTCAIARLWLRLHARLARSTCTRDRMTCTPGGAHLPARRPAARGRQVQALQNRHGLDGLRDRACAHERRGGRARRRAQPHL